MSEPAQDAGREAAPEHGQVPEAKGSDGTESDGTAAGAPRGGLTRAVAAGLEGESVSAGGVLEIIGGWRGVVESLLPATVFLVVFVVTREARIAAIAPVVISLIAVAVRLVRRETLSSALSGLLGVAVCAAAVLFTGDGQNYFVPGFFINAAWILAYTISLALGWPLIGLLLGFVRGSFTEWRRVRVLRRAAALCTALWAIVFSARLAVQLPFYFAAEQGHDGALEALGVARLVMGVPLFALAAVFTWLVLARVNAAAGDPAHEEHDPVQSSDE
ncbi:DUF3159 domain-containing protein [Leucobacter soli]|uniref:DUF3159 domain-containing protein n=1 Tax=Leucobacter soli TaxID=2812850 RepID=A0A916JYJ2_9MICO|nr:DUF3159 domain-containing protein [Leucobacter soli]CAG7611118.1 hypothetical protein LEUCIP111803_01395 [Leucobacter soli]